MLVVLPGTDQSILKVMLLSKGASQSKHKIHCLKLLLIGHMLLDSTHVMTGTQFLTDNVWNKADDSLKGRLMARALKNMSLLYGHISLNSKQGKCCRRSGHC